MCQAWRCWLLPSAASGTGPRAAPLAVGPAWLPTKSCLKMLLFKNGACFFAEAWPQNCVSYRGSSGAGACKQQLMKHEDRPMHFAPFADQTINTLFSPALWIIGGSCQHTSLASCTLCSLCSTKHGCEQEQQMSALCYQAAPGPRLSQLSLRRLEEPQGSGLPGRGAAGRVQRGCRGSPVGSHRLGVSLVGWSYFCCPSGCRLLSYSTPNLLGPGLFPACSGWVLSCRTAEPLCWVRCCLAPAPRSARRSHLLLFCSECARLSGGGSVSFALRAACASDLTELLHGCSVKIKLRLGSCSARLRRALLAACPGAPVRVGW